MLTLAIAILPAFFLCLFVYNKDVLEKEPTKLLMILFALGVASTIPASFMESIFSIFVNTESTNITNILITSFLGIALIEEGYKALFTYSMTWKNKEFNHIYDGIVYAVFTSLGFATLENILYVFSFGTGVGIMRAFVSVPGHAFFGVAMGYYMGIAKSFEKKNDKKNKNKYLALSIIVPVLFHGLFDFLLLIDNEILVAVFFGFVLILYIVSYLKIRKLSKVPNLMNNQM